MNAYVDIDREIEKVTMLLTYSLLNPSYTISNRINKNTKNFKLYLERYKSIIDKHFELIKQDESTFFVYPKRLNDYNKISNIYPIYTCNLTKLLNYLLYGKKFKSLFVSNILSTKLLKLVNPSIRYLVKE